MQFLRDRIDHGFKGQWPHLAIDQADDRAKFRGVFRQQELNGAVAEVPCVFGIERNGVGAAELLADFFFGECDVEFEFSQFLCETILDHATEIDFAHA